MNEPLRPLTLGEILDRTAQLYRRNFVLFAGVAALPTSVIVGVAAAFGGAIAAAVLTARGIAAAGALTGVTALLLAIIAAPVLIAATVFSQAGLTRAAVTVHNGETVKIRAALAGVKPRFWRYLGLLALEGLIVGGIPAVIALGAIAIVAMLARLAGAGAAASVGVGFFIFAVAAVAIVAMVWLALGYAMGLAVCVVEEKPSWDSLERAAKLSRGTRGRIFVMFLLVWALSMVLSIVGYIPIAIVTAIATAAGHGVHYAAVVVVTAEIVNVLVNFVVQTLIAPVYLIALVLFYFDQRVRAEGYDIERMMEQAGLIGGVHGFEAAGGLDGARASSVPPVALDTVKEL